MKANHNYKIGDEVYHPIDKAPFKVIGIKTDTVEIEGDFSGGTHNVTQRDWVKHTEIKPFNWSKLNGDSQVEDLPNDALGNPIEMGIRYGYSQQSSGRVQVVTGIVEKTKGSKVTLGNVEERSGLWGEIERPFHQESRRRSVNACHLFKI